MNRQRKDGYIRAALRRLLGRGYLETNKLRLKYVPGETFQVLAGHEDGAAVIAELDVEAAGRREVISRPYGTGDDVPSGIDQAFVSDVAQRVIKLGNRAIRDRSGAGLTYGDAATSPPSYALVTNPTAAQKVVMGFDVPAVTAGLTTRAVNCGFYYTLVGTGQVDSGLFSYVSASTAAVATMHTVSGSPLTGAGASQEYNAVDDGSFSAGNFTNQNVAIEVALTISAPAGSDTAAIDAVYIDFDRSTA